MGGRVNMRKTKRESRISNFGRASGIPLGFNFSVSDIKRMLMITLKLVDER